MEHLAAAQGQVAAGDIQAGHQQIAAGGRLCQVDHLYAPHCYQLPELTAGEHKVEIRIDNSLGSVPIAARTLYTLEVDVSGVMTTQEAAGRMEQAIADAAYSSGSMVKFVLTGEVEVDAEFNCEYLQDLFSDYFYFEKVYDQTKLRVNYSDYEKDESLKGEFIRMVLNSDMSEESKTEVIRCGIMALSGKLSSLSLSERSSVRMWSFHRDSVLFSLKK